jgi:hypothetical protein
MIRFAARALGRLLVLFPAFWIGGAMGFALSRCPGLGVGPCAATTVIAPFLMIFPSTSHDEDPPVEMPHLAILLVAAAASIVWEYASSRRRTQPGVDP